MTSILLIEDDLELAELISHYLIQHDFLVDQAHTGKSGLELAESLNPSLIILDLMLPEINGLSVCRQLRNWYQGRIIILTASDEDMDQVAALEMGADDFVTKPIHPRVLLARIRMLLRREGSFPIPDTTEELCYGSLCIHHGKRLVTLKHEPISLTEAEFSLLWFLANNPEQAMSRDDIMRATRGIEYDGIDRSIDNRVVSLRRKLGDDQGLPKRILTVRGKGYLFITDQW